MQPPRDFDAGNQQGSQAWGLARWTAKMAALEKSLKAMTSELSQEKREEVAKSVAGVYFIIGLKGAFNGKDQSEIEAEVGEMLHGKTASQIIAIADEIEKEMNQRNK